MIAIFILQSNWAFTRRLHKKSQASSFLKTLLYRSTSYKENNQFRSPPSDLQNASPCSRSCPVTGEDLCFGKSLGALPTAPRGNSAERWSGKAVDTPERVVFGGFWVHQTYQRTVFLKVVLAFCVLELFWGIGRVPIRKSLFGKKKWWSL